MNESLLFQYGSFSSVSKVGLTLLGFLNGKKFLRYIFNQSAALPCTCSPGLDAGLASVLCVVTQRLSSYELCHDTRNGCKNIDTQRSCWQHCYAWDTFLLLVPNFRAAPQLMKLVFSLNLSDFSLFLLFQSKAAYVLFYERQEPADEERMEEKEIEQNPDQDVDMTHDG